MQLIIFLFAIHSAIGMIGYDCGSRNLNITTISLLDVGACNIPYNDVNVTRKYIQLLQIDKYDETNVIQCKLEISRTIDQCGMFSHKVFVSKSQASYVYEIGRRTCTEMHKTGILKFNNNVITGLKVNGSITHSIDLAGNVDSNNICNGQAYSDPYGTWNNVFVTGTLKITLREFIAKINIDENKIYLKSGTTCSLSDSNCIDMGGGYSFWETIPNDYCKFNQFGILYEGYANKLIDNDYNRQVIYSLSTQDITFALASKSEDSVCGYKIVKTEHPKLVIFETVRGESFANKKQISVSNLDIFAYVNSKFVYVEKHIRMQMKQLYRDVIVQRCNLERETLKNSLAIATHSPDEFAYNLMKGPGFMAVVAGEVIHIIKCIPVEVKLEHGETCYAELRVTRNNQTYFLTPRTHILKRKGTEIICNKILPSIYKVGNSWYKFIPGLTDAHDPIMIKPMTRMTWNYLSPGELATSGIYTEKELEKLRERIMFPIEQPAVLNDIARELHGHPIPNDDGTLFKLLNEDAVTKIVESTWGRIWSKLVSFGTASAGIIAILIIFQVLKMIIEMCLNGYALHQIYGCSVHLLGAVWSTLAYFLITLRGQNTFES